MDTFSNTVQNTLAHNTFSTSNGHHLLPQVLSAMQSFWQLIHHPVIYCMISSEWPPTRAEFHWELELPYSELLVLPRTASLWSRHTRPAQVGLRLGRTVVAEVWRTAVLSHWHGSPASCCQQSPAPIVGGGWTRTPGSGPDQTFGATPSARLVCPGWC